MKIKSCVLTPVFIFLLFSVKGQVSNDTSVFRVVGYYSLQSAMTADIKDGPFNMLTHINLYFLNPDSMGNFAKNFPTTAWIQ